MSFGRTFVDWERRIDLDRMRKQRLDRLKRVARQKGIEALLLLGGDNMRYAGHNMGKGIAQGLAGLRFIFLPVSGEPILYEYGMWQPYVKDNVDWMEVRYAPSILAQGPVETRVARIAKVASMIKKDMQDSKVISIALDVYHVGLAKALEKEGVSVTLDGEDVMREARKIKFPEEVECIRIGSAISEGAFYKLERSIHPGVSEADLRSIFIGELYRLGMEFVPTGEVISGPRNYLVNMTSSDRLIRHGDMIVVNACQSSFLGYRVCYYRTFVCGRADEEQKDCFGQTRDLLQKAIEITIPGNTTRDIALKWPSAREFGYQDEDQALWVQWGHGIGLGIPEQPTASRLWSLEYPEKIEEGMTIALETWLPTKKRSATYPHGQAARLEEMLLVTNGGSDLISSYPMDELIECT
ncbi:MAG: M24 family metallopeptidase [Nitrososphaerales archaeon]